MRTRRTQILMEPEEFRRLRALARQRKTSIAQLIRRAVQQAYFESDDAEARAAAAESIIHMNLPVVEWKDAKKEIEAMYDEADLP